jgi:protease-4
LRIPVAAAVVAVLGLATLARADDASRKYAEEPTDGVALPTAGLAGDPDARSVSLNPGGLALLHETETAFALELEHPDIATSAGAGFGAFIATPIGGKLLPKLGLGMGLEWLDPSRSHLAPDPGRPFRFTLAVATAPTRAIGVGAAWHHFHAEGALDGVDTFDLGLSAHLGNHVGFGFALRDLATSPIAGTPVQRRYEFELVGRPLGRDVLEAAAGWRIGETRLDQDVWGRVSWRLLRGVTLHGVVESRALHALVDSPLGRSDRGGRDLRITAGLEFSFGAFDVTATATGQRSDTGADHYLGSELVFRTGAAPPSVLGHRDHIERVELSGDLTALVMRLRAMAHDRSALGVVFTIDGLGAGYAALEEIRDEILALRRAKKLTFAYMVSGTSRDYYVASAADKIYMDPAGMLRLVGMAATTLYFRGAFDKVGILPQYEKIAEYKSAPEQLTEIGPTATAAKMHEAMYGSLWSQWLSTVAGARHLSTAALQALVDAGPYSAGELAKLPKLVDAVAPPDKIAQLVIGDIGHVVPLGAPPDERPTRWTRPRVAVIYVDGDITDGASRSVPWLGQHLAGGETLIAALAAARADPGVSAIVLRIDSPGGSALASELISREVFAARGVKPIICSMGNVAASGGYFIAAGCDVIYAEPMTITGSIGIFFGKFDLGGLIAKLGVTTETVAHGAHADAESKFKPYTDEERASLLDKLTYMYGRFVGAVAEGRGMSKADVDAVGRGHVWTGEQAKPEKLVDQLGGFGAALDEAKRRAGIAPGTEVELVELPAVYGGILGTIGGLLGGREQARGAEVPGLSFAELPLVRELVRGVPASMLVSPNAAQARLPFDVSWE